MDLTTVERFTLGDFDITPARCEIARGQTVARVEPKVMAVLIALARRRGETVSREKLFDDVWDGRAVTDDALTRCISALRRVFRDGTGVEIKALPKLGYILTAEPSAAKASPATVAPPQSGGTFSLSLAVAAAGFALAVAMAAVLSFRMPPAPDTASTARITPLTSLPGFERYPALNPSGGQLAFAHRDAAGQWDLYVKSVAPGGEPQRLTNDAAREQHPVWSHTGEELAYIRSTGDACELMRVAIPGGTPRKVADCGAKLVHSLDWSPDGRLFALTRTDARLDPAGLAFIALEGASPSVTIDRTLGAEDAHFSPQGTQVALTLSTAIGAEDVYTIDLASGRLDRVTNDNAKVHGLDWTDDGQAIVYASNRGGSFGLHRVTPGGRPISLQPSLQDIENPSVVGARIAYEAWTETGKLNTFALGDGAPPLLPPDSTRLEWHPDVSSDGAIAFVSDRGGAPEVWLSQNGAARQLTFFGDAYIHTPKFSPDGQTIAFSAPRAGRTSLFIVGRDGTLRRLTDEDANDMSPAWSASGRTLYFASDRGGTWRPWKLDLATGRATLVADTPARAVYTLNKRELLIVDPVKGGLYRLDLTKPTAPPLILAADTAPSDWANVLVADSRVFYIRREPPDRAVLHRIDLETGKDETLADMEDFYFRSGLALAGGSLIYATTRVEDVGLMLFEEHPKTAQAEEKRMGSADKPSR